MPPRKKVLFLYTEIAGYFLACVKTLLQDYPVDIHVIRFPVNKEAPFLFDLTEQIYFYERKNYSYKQLQALVESIHPDFIYCSGWIDKDYLKICSNYKNVIPTVLAIDNPWNGSYKQIIATALFRGYIQKRFSHVWIPGKFQYEYAKKLGFKNENILQGVYSIDADLFHQEYYKHKENKNKNFPKRFLFVGRYNTVKGIDDLWNVFIELQNANPSEWELWCVGTGDLEKQFPVHPKIKNLGFLQPQNLIHLIKETGVFVLPSHFEPWGVVVHEFASAGFPLICSDKVGATEMFLQHGKNGFIFPAGTITLLKEYLLKVMRLSDEELNKMGERSVELAKQNTPHDWATTIYKLIQ